MVHSKSSKTSYTKEKDLKKDVKELLTRLNIKYFMPVPTGYSEGAVDFLVCYNGHFLAIETKIHPRKPTKLQIDFLISVHKSGGSAVLAYDMDEVELALIAIDEGRVWISEELEPWLV